MANIYSFPVTAIVYGTAYYTATSQQEAFGIYKNNRTPMEACKWDDIESCSIESSGSWMDMQIEDSIPDGIKPFGAEVIKKKYADQIEKLESELETLKAAMKKFEEEA